MNLVIIDPINKEYHPYIHVSEKIEMFIRDNVIKINDKNKTYLEVHTDVEIQNLIDTGFSMNQALFDKLVLEYNSTLQVGEKRLELWIRD